MPRKEAIYPRDVYKRQPVYLSLKNAQLVIKLPEIVKNESLPEMCIRDSNSRLFAETSANIFSANGIKVYLFDDMRPTPEMSFAIRHLGCQSGIILTASHNPKEYRCV